MLIYCVPVIASLSSVVCVSKWRPIYTMSGKPIKGNHKQRRQLVRAATKRKK